MTTEQFEDQKERDYEDWTLSSIVNKWKDKLLRMAGIISKELDEQELITLTYALKEILEEKAKEKISNEQNL